MPTGFQGSNRKVRLPGNWQAIRFRILRRDGWKCTICQMPASEVDHIIRGDDHSDENLQSLCKEHHASKTGREGQAAMIAKRNDLRSRYLRRKESRFD